MESITWKGGESFEVQIEERDILFQRNIRN